MNNGLKRILAICFMGLLLGSSAYVIFHREKAKHFEEDTTSLHEAMYYEKSLGRIVQCHLCYFECVLSPGQYGRCQARKNINGTLYSLVYGKAFMAVLKDGNWGLIYCAVRGNVLEIGPPGCNMHCNFCRSSQWSTADPSEVKLTDFKKADLSLALPNFGPAFFPTAFRLSPEEVIEVAKKFNCKIIAYSITEPTIFYEFMLDIAKLARKNGLKNVFSTNGYITKGPLEELLKYMDGISLGIKGFNEDFYRHYTEAEFKPALDTLTVLRDRNVAYEITYPLIPNVNDDPAQLTVMATWIKDHLGPKTPLNFLEYRPSYRLLGVPPTSLGEFERAEKIAQNAGLKFVFSSHYGKITTLDFKQKINCPACGNLILTRNSETTINNTIKGRCKFCNERIAFISAD